MKNRSVAFDPRAWHCIYLVTAGQRHSIVYYSPKCLHHLSDQHWEQLKKTGFPIPKGRSKLDATLAAVESPEEQIHEQFLRDVDHLLHLATSDLRVISGAEGKDREASLVAEHER